MRTGLTLRRARCCTGRTWGATTTTTQTLARNLTLTLAPTLILALTLPLSMTLTLALALTLTLTLIRCNYNSPAGMTVPSRAWSAIRQSAAAYCDRAVHAYDDAIHALQNAPPAGIHTAGAAGRQGSSLPPRALEPGWLTNSYPRCVHVGRCGGLSFRLETALGSAEEAAAACNVTRDALDFAAVCVYVDKTRKACVAGPPHPIRPVGRGWPHLSAAPGTLWRW